MTYIPIHNHSEYSSLDGLATCRELVERVVDLGYEAVGISDHGTVAGHPSFQNWTRDAGVRPIYGAELYHGVRDTHARNARDQAHLLCGARTDEGLRNLWRLTDAAASNHYYVPRVIWAMLSKYSEGLFCTSACIQGLVSQGIRNGDLSDLNRYLDIFGEHFYIELHTYPTEEQERINLELLQIAQEKGLPTLIANDAHYAYPEQYEVHDAYVAGQVKDNVYKDPADRKMWHPKGLYIQSEDEIRKNLSYLDPSDIDEAFANSTDLAQSVDASLPEVKRHLPMFVPRDCPWLDSKSQETSAVKLFIDLVQDGLVWRYGEDAPDSVYERAEQEMRVFLEGGLEHYFLQAWDFVQFCDDAGIRRGPGRGSAGGAIVAYALGITDIDPLKYDLKFERFYNPGRAKGFPDIDNDFPTGRRTEVRNYMRDRWGKDKVRSIGTITRMKPKAAIDAFWYVMDVTFEEKEKLKTIIGKVPDIDIHGPDTIGWDEEIDPGKSIYVVDHVGDEIEKFIKTSVKREPILSRWVDLLRVVCCRVQHYGVHPSGIVISDVDLGAELPCRWSTSEKAPVTMFPMDLVETRQFVKQDFLGLRNLDTLEEWESQIGRMDWSGLEWEEHPEGLWEMLDKGLTLGIFQIEDGYARRLCKEIQPRSVEELAAIIALNRPGPIRANVPDSYIARKFGLEEVEYDHPILEPILESTYGHFLYQEQIIEFMGALGYDPSDADEVRKILGKKKPEVMRAFGNGSGEWTGKGYQQMAAQAGVDPTRATIIWDKLEGFASYSFNKSHAVAYATLAFRTLYAKFTGPAEYIIALLRTNPERAGGYVMEGRKMGITVKAPEIDRSGVDVEVMDGDILFGFSNIKGIGRSSAQYICELRDQYDLSSVELLYEAVETEQKKWEEADNKPKRSPRQKFRSNLYVALYQAGCWDNYEERNLALMDRQAKEKELLQVILTDDTLEVFDNNLDRLADCHEYSDLDEGPAVLNLPGVIMSLKEKLTKKDRKPMGIVTIEYEGDEAEFVVFPKQWSQYKFLWKERTPGLFNIKRTDRGLHFESGVKLS